MYLSPIIQPWRRALALLLVYPLQFLLNSQLSLSRSIQPGLLLPDHQLFQVESTLSVGLAIRPLSHHP